MTFSDQLLRKKTLTKKQVFNTLVSLTSFLFYHQPKYHCLHNNNHLLYIINVANFPKSYRFAMLLNNKGSSKSQRVTSLLYFTENRSYCLALHVFLSVSWSPNVIRNLKNQRDMLFNILSIVYTFQ